MRESRENRQGEENALVSVGGATRRKCLIHPPYRHSMDFSCSNREYSTKLRRSLKSRAICMILMTSRRAAGPSDLIRPFPLLSNATSPSDLIRSFFLLLTARCRIVQHESSELRTATWLLINAKLPVAFQAHNIVRPCIVRPSQDLKRISRRYDRRWGL